jgi:hypothetical protein
MEMDFEHKGVSRGAVGSSLGFGIAGTALGLLNGGLGNIFGGVGNNTTNAYVNRYELDMQKQITDRDAEISYLKGRDAAKTDSLELYKYVDGRLRGIESQICQQAVVNASVTANISCMQTAIAALQGLTKTVIPIGNVCPEPMPQYNSWTAPTATT